ncbi:PAOX oxidase, partial [Atractosteus spatula]|nr:PAOX oxidase [Atractosteus spatula]
MACYYHGLDSHIVVVGCGISGIGAAQKLLKHGFKNVRILEATQRSGGRIKTTRLGNKIVEIGANWIHGPSKENPVFRLACQYRLLDEEALSEQNQALDVGGHPPFKPNWFCSSGRKLGPDVTEPVAALFMDLFQQSQRFHAEQREPVPSVGEFLKGELARHAAQWRDGPAARRLKLAVASVLLKLECSINGAHSMDCVGLGAYGLYETLPGLDCTFPRGYEGLIDAMMKELPRGIVSYSRPVRCIHWGGAFRRAGKTFPVLIECENGETFPANHVIITVPLGYLKKHHDTLLSPALPLSKAHAIQRMGFGTNNKIFLEFDEPFWEPGCEVIYFVWDDESSVTDVVPDVQKYWMKKLFGFTVLRPTEKYGHLLCGWIAGEESEYMETLSEEEVKQSITQVIRRFTGNPVITPKRILRSQWHLDPYTCGSYSYVAVGCSASDIDSIAEPLPLKQSHSEPLQVLFAGEATSKSFFSTTHGALLAGWREADRLIAHHTTSPPSAPLSSRL